MSNAVLFAIALAVGAALWLALRPKSDPEALKAFLAKGALVLDVRTPGEFRRLHAKAARNIPVDELERRIEELGAPGPIVVYCASGMRSRRATMILSGRGFEVLDVGRVTAFPPDLLEKLPNNAPV
ncbi:MAG: rhodanese-like domain-containing protein [Alphaproteobacteria bacterium]|nr:rhodanese-like domain-containing protein [Alphaproteobacteria bacterium]MCB9675462.1 rhodanese-like domain-containing protein [Alphaproteobacteria bacterium]